MSDSGVFGQSVRRIRTETGLTAAQLAARTPGLTSGSVGKIERGELRPTVEHLLTLAAALEVSPATLLMPPAATPFETVELPGGVSGSAASVWAWITATGPVPTGEAPGVAVAEADQPVPSPEEAEQLLRSWPRWAGLPPRLRQA